jgi:MscS family membrane protein
MPLSALPTDGRAKDLSISSPAHPSLTMPPPRAVLPRMTHPQAIGGARASTLLVSALLLLPTLVSAQTFPGLTPTPSPTPTASPEPGAEAPDSPRASARRYLDLAGVRGDDAGAARYLMLSADEKGRGPELARRLRAVLERRLRAGLDALSPLAEGAADDGLPAGIDRVGEVPDGRGGEDPVFLVRTRDEQGTYWAFSRQTVSRIDGWYDALPDRWIRDWIPASLQLYGPVGLMWWQWLAVPGLVAVALALGRLLGGLTRAILFRLAQRTKTGWDERLLERVSPAFTLLWSVAVAEALLHWLALLPAAERFVRQLLGGIAAVAVFWALWRSVDVWTRYLSLRPGVADSPSARSLLALFRNFAKAVVALGGVLATLSAFGYPVTTVLAGLGIGGLAIAFGAQKTVENLFGSVALAVDQPFRVGDFVKIEDFVGNVERIGMRSTQVRTLDRTLVTIPNGRLSEMRIEDFAARDRIRFTCTVGLVYETTEAQMTRILAGMEKVLRDDPRTWPDTVVVRFAGFGASSLDVEVMAWFLTSDYNAFRDCRQDALLGFMRVVEAEGSSFAFPTRTVHHVTASAAPPAATGGGAGSPAPAQPGP